jgi:hypothetical protein
VQRRFQLRDVALAMVTASCFASACAADESAPPDRLSSTGLYADVASGRLADGVRAFRPQFELWSDGASKRRWFSLPPGTQIDTSNMDGWRFPVGTKLWKEFSRDGVRVETRLLRKDGPGPQEWTRIAYVWSDDQSDATAVPDGRVAVHGTSHDVPDTVACRSCHGGASDGVIGFSAIQLDHDLGDVTLSTLVADGLLTQAPSGKLGVPGNDVERAALGYLHVNCGPCHNDRVVKPAIPLRLELATGSLASVADTPIFRTAIGAPSRVPQPLDETTATTVIVPGDPASSLLHLRMIRREPQKGQMPPLATKLVDQAGSDAVAAWIRSLPPSP